MSTHRTLPRTDGERWAHEELRRLRERRGSPAAVAAFLLASRRRAGDVRRARPELARRARRWELLGAATWAVLALGGCEPFRRRVVSGLAWWAATSAMLEWHLGMVESDDGVPRNLGPADAMTLARAWLVPVVADDLAPGVVLAAALTDGLDGALARASVPTRAGRDLEGLVDAALLVSALRCAHRTERLSPWVVALESGRVAVGFGYALACYLARAQPPRPALVRAARLTTPVRVTGLICAGRGRRRLAEALVAASSLASLALLATSLRGGSLDRRA